MSCHVWLAMLTYFSGASMFGSPAKPGHLKPIGNQSPPQRGGIDELDCLLPSTAFYRDYWMSTKPVVFRRVLRSSQAMKYWRNSTYMAQKYGNTVGLVDRRTTWKRGGVESPPRSVMNFKEFLSRLPDEQVYWDDEIPVGHEILHDVPIPLSLDCEEFSKKFFYANLMVNSGNVSYVLHSDHADNFFHLFAGEKTWLIANSSFRESMYMGQDAQSADMSPVEPDSVDLHRFPKMSHVVFHEIDLHAGDLLYVPANWPHYVRSKGTPNIAMNIWFERKDFYKKAPEKPACKRQLRSASALFKVRDIGRRTNETNRSKNTT